jgi:hypothetical protein
MLSPHVYNRSIEVYGTAAKELAPHLSLYLNDSNFHIFERLLQEGAGSSALRSQLIANLESVAKWYSADFSGLFAIENQPWSMSILDRTSEENTIRFWSNAAFAQQLIHLKKIPHCIMRLDFSDGKLLYNLDVVKGIPPVALIGHFDDDKSICSSSDSYMPKEILQLASSDRYSTVPVLTPNEQCRDFIIEYQAPVTAKHHAMNASLFEGISTHVSASPSSPIFLADKTFFEGLLKASGSTRAHEMLYVIEIMKVKNQFAPKHISKGTYLANPNKYILCTPLPKIISFYVPLNAPNTLALRLVANFPTLIIPLSFINEKNKSYPLAKQFFSALAKDRLEELLHPEEYIRKVKNLGLLSRHWDGPLQILSGVSTQDINRYLGEHNHFSHKSTIDLSPIFNALETVPEISKFRGLAFEHKTLKDGQQDSKHCLSATEALAIGQQRDKKRYETELKICEQALEETGKRSHQLRADLITLDKQLEVLEPHFNAEKLALETNIRKAYETISLEAKNNLVISKIRTEHQTLDTYLFSNLAEMTAWQTTRLAPWVQQFLTGKDKLITVVLATNEPNKIYVDLAEKPIEECPVVIGGPYRIHLTYNQADNLVSGTIFLKDISSVFGMRSIDGKVFEAKQHPHSTPLRVYKDYLVSYDAFVKSPTKMCFGEIETNLIDAFEKRDLGAIKLAAFRWLTSAWSKDQWGKQWNWFPTP